ncbi:hypothetical protein KSP40_PGU012364 [Platanthera guangdongensis]|uniref:Uncharacterized protein n=1 Tax=Platanthera guangdongensis TaxID=2320717 RepID=A0ABR2N4D6_9ASPA
MANDGDSKITLKLLIDARGQKVLFAEAGNDFIDFMFSTLILPLGSIIKLISPATMVGSIGKLYKSVENLKETYLIPNRDKAALLQPTIPCFAGASPLLLAGADAMNQITYYSCQTCHKRVTSAKNINCPTCKKVMSGELDFVLPWSSSSSRGVNEWDSEGGFVKGVITYMITDDLEVTPMSAISSITLINRFSMKKDVLLEEKVVTVGMNEGLALLEASLESQTPLTDVFLAASIKKAIFKEM